MPAPRDFEQDLPMLMLGVTLSVTARRCFYARKRLQAALSGYYGDNLDDHEDVAQIVKNRANVLRKHGISGKEVGIFEVGLLHVATFNTIPILFWCMAYIFTRPELVVRLRDEVSPVAERGDNDQVTLDISRLDEKCPLLVSCYCEAIWLSSKGMGNRRVMEDTTISDGSGVSYLLREGCSLQMSAQVSHSLEKAWGPDSGAFTADRFVGNGGKDGAEAEKLRRASYMPFGGGRHLCPGRNFAFAENLGFLASLLLGFEVAFLDENMKRTGRVPETAPCVMTGAVSKPIDNGRGYGIRVSRRGRVGKCEVAVY